MPVIKPLIGLLAYQAPNINSLGKLITLKSSLGTAAIGFYIVGTVGRPIFATSSANSFSNLVLFTLSALSLAVLL